MSERKPRTEGSADPLTHRYAVPPLPQRGEGWILTRERIKEEQP
jgi:hypothetical protein